MVQRTWLALILLLTLAVSLLVAQNTTEFSLPKLLSEPLLEVPDDFNIPAKDVLILVEVKTDSTATLIKILDGKEELRPNIEKLLPYLMFVPAMQKGVLTTSTLSIKLAVKKSGALKEQKAASDSLTHVDKDTLFKWINHHRTIENRQLLFSSEQDSSGFIAPQMNDTFYSTNFYMMGLNNRPYLIVKDGFIEPARIYYNALSYQMLSGFREVRADKDIVSFQNNRYPHPAMCTDVYAGLGDYEFNFARGQVYKNHLFGVKDFYTEFGFLVQNGWWQETISDQTSSRLFLSLPIKNTTLSFNFEKYDQNIPSSTLLPGMQNGSLFRIGHKLQDIYLKYETPFGTLGWNAETETMSSPGIMNKQDYESGRLLYKNSANLVGTEFKINYQYNYKLDVPAVQSLYQFSKFRKHEILLSALNEIESLRTKISFQLLLGQVSLDKANIDITHNINTKSMIGLFFDHYIRGENTAFIQKLYTDNTPQDYPAACTRNTIAIKSNFLLGEVSNIKTYFGGKYITKTIFVDGGVSGNYSTAYTPLYSEMEVNLSKHIGAFIANLDQTLQWTQYKEGIFEQPEFTGQTRPDG